MNEFEFIEKLASAFGGGVSAIGDDAVLFDDKYLIAKDIMAEGVHFLKKAPLDLVVKKLFASNISDIAAMGGEAGYALLGVASPDSGYLEKIFLGIKEASELYDIKVIGGDTSRSEGGLFLSMTVIGKKGTRILSRSGAKAGDIFYLSRPLGLAKLSLEKELGLIKDADIDPLFHYKIAPEKELGKFLGEFQGVTAACDISDGLGRDLSHIAKASGVKVVIEEESLRKAAPETPGDKIKYFLTSGEEFALLFSVSPSRGKALEKAVSLRFGRDILRIGRAEEGEGVFLKNGGFLDISQQGWDHFEKCP